MKRFLLFSFLLTRPANAVDPSIEWKSIKTPHFEIIYDAKQHYLAEQYALYAEYSFDLLNPIFKEFPQKATLVIDDSADQANGFATRLPYPLIIVRPVLPEPSESIGRFGNWGYEVVLHEYSHILSFEPAHGFIKPLRYIFGSIINPNLFLPRWWLEGLAVKLETNLSEWGRLRSPQQEAVLRALVQDNKLENENIARANETDILEYPFGARPYLLGSLFWQKVETTAGSEAIYKLTQRHSQRVPFFFLDTPIKDIMGDSYENFFKAALEDAQAKAQNQLAVINKASGLEMKEIPFEGMTSFHPEISPDEKKLLYITQGHNWNSEIQIINGQNFLSSGKDRINHISRISWHPQSNKIIYDKVGADSDRYNIYFDLYERDLNHFNQERQVTRAQRAKHPAYSPDGQQIVFIQNGPGQTHLALMPVEGSSIQVLYSPPLQHRISYPEFLNANEIIFSERNLKGEEFLIVLNLKENKTRQVLKDFAPAYRPRKTKEGIIFISERTGVANAYLANLSLTQAKALSNSPTAITSAAINRSSQKLFLTQLTGQGSRIFEAQFSPEKKINPPQIPLSQNIPIRPDIQEAQLHEKLKNRLEHYTVENYSAWPYMLPKYWLPFVYPLQNGVFIEATTSNSDPLGKHAYSGVFTYNSSTLASGYYLSYWNHQTSWPLVFSYSSYDEYVLNSTSARKNQLAFAGVQTFIYSLPKQWQLLGGWTYSQRDVTTREVIRSGPKLVISYNSISQKGDEISPETGGLALMGYTHYVAEQPTANRLDYEEYTLEFSHYFSKWLPKRHVIYSHFKGFYANYPSTLVAGAFSAPAAYQSTVVAGEFLMRGYPSAAFWGTKIANLNLEYRFPISKIYRGAGLTPFFAKRLHGRLFVDSIFLDGFFYDSFHNGYFATNIQKGYSGVGTEIHLDSTTFFYLPLDLYLGLYYGTNDVVSGGGITPFIGLSL